MEVKKSYTYTINNINTQALGIGAAPHSATNLHIKHASPQIRMEDSTHASNYYSKILQDNLPKEDKK